MAYARVQEAFRQNRGRCAKKILDGSDESEIVLSVDDQDRYWRQLFSHPSKEDKRPAVPTAVSWPIVDPITPEEVEETLRKSGDNSPGPDSLTLKQERNLNIKDLTVAFNQWLLQGYVPTDALAVETVLIFKDGDMEVASNYRPITIASHVLRVFHRILAKRLDVGTKIHERQKAFKHVDGCAENMFLLDDILKEAKRKPMNLCLALLDVTKAFRFSIA